MPNWCDNMTYVYGKSEQVKALHDAIETASQSEGFNGFMGLFYPVPEELLNSPANFSDLENPVHPNWLNLVADGTWTQEEYDKRAAEAIADAEAKKVLVSKYGFKDWYDWCISNWGTKWGDCETRWDYYDYSNAHGILTLSYDTAWGPMLEGLTKLSEMQKGLVFFTFYREPGMYFEGYHKVANGEVLEDESREMIPNSSDIEWLIESTDEQEIDKLLKGETL